MATYYNRGDWGIWSGEGYGGKQVTSFNPGDIVEGGNSPGVGWSYAGTRGYSVNNPRSGHTNMTVGQWRYDGVPAPAPPPPPAPAPPPPAPAPPPVVEKPKVEFDASQYMARQPTPEAPKTFEADITPKMYESFAGSAGRNAFQSDTTARSYDDFVKGLNREPAAADDAEKGQDEGRYVTRFAASGKFRDAIDERLGLRPDDPAYGADAERSDEERRRARFSMDYR